MFFEKTTNKDLMFGIDLLQIRYTKDNPKFNVKAGDLGGWVSKTATLSNDGNWFLSDESIVFGGYIYGGSFKDVVIWGGEFHGGIFNDGQFKFGSFPIGFGKVPFVAGPKYSLNFSGYTEDGERIFGCGCQIYPESKWTPEFRKYLAQKYFFTQDDLELSEILYEGLKKMTPTMNLKKKDLT